MLRLRLLMSRTRTEETEGARYHGREIWTAWSAEVARTGEIPSERSLLARRQRTVALQRLLTEQGRQTVGAVTIEVLAEARQGHVKGAHRSQKLISTGTDLRCVRIQMQQIPAGRFPVSENRDSDGVELCFEVGEK